ncbi:MAG: response regulator [Rhodospirillales bacterium]
MAKILVIDDEMMLRDDIADALRSGGHVALEAADGREGLDVILRERPDLVLSDINMPGMDGRELLSTLRETHPEHSTLPFLFLSAYSDREDVIAGKKLGADDYLTKPVDHDLMLETVNARLRQAARFEDRRRDELAAMQQSVLSALPHELRTPLNSILGFAELLCEEIDAAGGPAHAAEYAAAIADSSRRLHALIEQVLDLARITAGQLAPNLVPVDVADVVEACADALRVQADGAGVALTVELPPVLPPVAADPSLLGRAMRELVVNAIKFTDRGGAVAVSAAVGADGRVRIVVADTGRGIDAEWLARLGAPFARPDVAIVAGGDKGPGLGLSLARAFVNLIGGELSLSSRVRVGTRAEIVLAA